MNNENTSLTDLVNNALGETTTEICTPVTPTLYKDAEDYKRQTGKRFRLTKEELEKYGKDKRDEAFQARQSSGSL